MSETKPGVVFAFGEEQTALVARIASLLAEVYTPVGVLTYWSARITYLDHKRPCDLLRDRDWDALRTLASRLDAIADGNFA